MRLEKIIIEIKCAGDINVGKYVKTLRTSFIFLRVLQTV